MPASKSPDQPLARRRRREASTASTERNIFFSIAGAPDGGPCETRPGADVLRQTLRTEAVGRLASGFIHDFANLLTVVLNAGTLALSRLPDGHPARRDIENTVEAGEQASQLVRLFLAFSRRRGVEPETASVAAVVGDMEGMLRRLLGSRVTLHVDTEETPGTVQATRSQVEVILIHLIANVRDALPDGGRIAVGTEILVRSIRTGGRWMVRVSVRGDAASRTTRPPGPLAPALLALVASIGGRIGADFTPRTGPAFRLDLPWVEAFPEE